MARLSRLFAPGIAQHLIQRGIQGQPVFRDDEDYLQWQADMRESAREHHLAVHAYVLLPDHFHLLATAPSAQALSAAMQALGRRYVAHFNHKYKRNGTLWEGRYRSTLIEPGQYFHKCSQYIETHPVRIGLADEPGHYPWSSYAHHVGTTSDPLITDHDLYWSLGNTPFERQATYRLRFESALTGAELAALTAATNKGWAWGDETFLLQMEHQANRRVRPLARGRPRSNAANAPKAPKKGAN
jgi:putative transposase